MILDLKKVREIFKKFIRVQFRHVPRAENSRADALAKLATVSQVPVEQLPEPLVNIDNEEVSPVMFESRSMDHIQDYLVDGILPSDPKKASKLITRLNRFTIHWGTLYKRGLFTPILKCVRKEDTNYVLREVHEGICGNHIGARTLAAKTMRQGYYWPTMLKAAKELVRNCKICQVHSQISHLPFEPLTSITSPWLFQQWGLNILGPLPIRKGQCKFIVVGVDYFTRWGKAEPLATITKQKVHNFSWRSIICRFGIPRSLVSNNGKQFHNPKFRYFYPELGIKYYYSSPVHPHSNGQAEVTIRTLKAALKTKLENLKGK